MIDLEKQRKLLDREITFFHFGRAKKKIAMCLKEADKTNNTFFRYYFLAQFAILKENFRTAIRYLDYAIEIRNNDGCAYNDKALCLADLGEYTKSLVCFDEGIKKDKGCVSLYHNKGWLLNSLGRYRESLLCFKKALELDEDRPEALFSLADTCHHLGDIDSAGRYFKKSLSLIKGRCAFMRRETLKRLRTLRKLSIANKINYQ